MRIMSPEQIMSDAGLTHGGFYRHFSGKDELYAAAVRQFLCKKTPAAWQMREARAVTTADVPAVCFGVDWTGDRKSVEPMAARLSPGDYDQLHHFIADGVWDAAPLESELLIQADRLVGGKDAVLVIDDTALPKKGDRS